MNRARSNTAMTLAGSVPLISVLGIAVAAGAVVSELRTMQAAIESLSRKVDGLTGEATRRIGALEQWQAVSEATRRRSGSATRWNGVHDPTRDEGSHGP